ncbi:MAG: hypothetical protein Q8Q09_03290 [Deltaproteobacteria bacterium]|nr:hypothetical protein [Deltaproteobacteria bacterium]
MKSLLSMVAMVATLAVAPTVMAQAAPTTPPAGDSDTVQASVQTQGGRRVYVASATIEVRGEIQRPYAFSLSGRSSLGYSFLEVPVRFVQEIINAVRRAPF